MIQGAALSPADRPRLLTQHDQVRAVMLDGRWRSYEEIQATVAERFGRVWPLTSIARQVRYLRAPEHGGHCVERERAAGRDAGLWRFRVVRGWGPDGQGRLFV